MEKSGMERRISEMGRRVSGIEKSVGWGGE